MVYTILAWQYPAASQTVIGSEETTKGNSEMRKGACATTIALAFALGGAWVPASHAVASARVVRSSHDIVVDTSGPYLHAAPLQGVSLVAVPCTPSRTSILPRGIASIDEARAYAVSHTSEAILSGCPHGVNLGVVVTNAAQVGNIDQRSNEAKSAFDTALASGADEKAAIVAAVLTFDVDTIVPAPVSVNPDSCSQGSNAFTYNNDTVLNSMLGQQGVIEWELWYNTSGAGCNHTFQQAEYQFVSGSNIWVQYSTIYSNGTGVFSYGSVGCTTCYTNIPVTYSFGANNTNAWPLEDETWYCTSVSGSSCNARFRHTGDNIST